jgi:hypothetical protein
MLPASVYDARRLFHSLLPPGPAVQFAVTGSFRFGKEPQKAANLDFIVYGIGTNRPQTQWPGLTEWEYSANYDNGYKATVTEGPYTGLCINIITFDDWELYLDWRNAAETLAAIPLSQRPAGKDARVKMHEALLADYAEQRGAEVRFNG